MWISGGEHELRENIVHLVLAKIPGRTAPAGREGHLAVRRAEVPGRGRGTAPARRDVGERNDVVLAGLNHKMGYRGTTNTLLNFGEGRFQPQGRRARSAIWSASRTAGLACMFHMMNEARIGVGLGAAMLGYTGYLHSLDYAREPPAGPPDRPGRQGPGAAAGADHRARRRPAHAAGAEGVRRGRAGAEPAAARRWSTTSTTAPTADERAQRDAAARHPHADREELAVAVVPRRQHPRDPGARRLRLHPRLRRRAVLPRQPAEPDPRGHARHPGARPARPQGRDAGRRRAGAARLVDGADDPRGGAGPARGHAALGRHADRAGRSGSTR